MDLGFGSFLDKFEQHFGRLLTRALVALLGLAVAATCVSIIWGFIGLPLYRLLSEREVNHTFWSNLDSLASPLWTVLIITTATMFIFRDLMRWKEGWQLRKMRVLLARRETIIREMEQTLQEGRSHHLEALAESRGLAATLLEQAEQLKAVREDGPGER